MRRGRDVPTDTPIDRGFEMDPEHQEVWTFVRRDPARERELLTAIQERLAANTTPTAD
jgi:hypothetical protein